MNLFMVELLVPDWSAVVSWYENVLGLQVEICDEAGRFALFAMGAGRLALKEGEPNAASVTLFAEVADLDGELTRLAGYGVTPEGEVKTSREGYRRAIVRDPAGHRWVVFAWVERRGED